MTVEGHAESRSGGGVSGSGSSRGSGAHRVVGRIWRWFFIGPFLYGITAFPLTVFGRARRATELCRARLEGRVGSGSAPQPVPSPARGRTTQRTSLGARMLLLLPLTLVVFVLALLMLYLVWAGQLYPLRPDTFETLAHPLAPSFGPGTWGGPTLLGAWLAHGVIALGMQLVAGLLIRGLAVICRRLTEPRLG